MKEERTLGDLAGQVVEQAAELTNARPSPIAVLWCFSLVAALHLADNGDAKPAAQGEVAMKEAALINLYPSFQETVRRYLSVCENGSLYELSFAEFSQELLPGALGFVFDVRLVRDTSGPNVALVFQERFTDAWAASDEAGRYQILLITQTLLRHFRPTTAL